MDNDEFRREVCQDDVLIADAMWDPYFDGELQ